MSAALRHPGCACSHSPLEGMGSPSQNPDREEPGVARAEAGESLRLTGDPQSATRASCSKIPRRRACHTRRTIPAPPRCDPYSPRLRLGLPDGTQRPRWVHSNPDREEPGVARAEAGNICDSRATPRRPVGHPVAKSPAPSMPSPANQSCNVSMRPAYPALALSRLGLPDGTPPDGPNEAGLGPS